MERKWTSSASSSRGGFLIYPLQTLYKRDTTGKIREWTIEYSGPVNPGIRTISGIKGGKLVTSEWNESFAKNVGRANATTAFEQAQKEAEAKWKLNLDKEYFRSIENIDKYDKFKPMLAHEYSKNPVSEGISQPKLDGIRCIATKDGLFSRQGKVIISCPHIFEDLKRFFEAFPDQILDGELYNHELKNDFNKITSLVRKTKPTEEDLAESKELVQYWIYDQFDPHVPDCKFLARFLGFDYGSVYTVPTKVCYNQKDLDDLYRRYTEVGYEGQMIRANEPYQNKRSKFLLKRKEFITEEFDVIEVLEGEGNWSGYAKHFRLELGDGREFKSGVRGNQKVLKKLLRQEVKPNWVTVRYFEKTPDGIPRFPVVIDWGIGKRND